MGMCYHLWLQDDYRWQYANDAVTKETVDAQVKAICPHAVRVAEFECWMVYETDKTPPAAFAGKVACDMMYSTEEPWSDPTPRRVPNAEHEPRRACEP